MAHEVQHFGEYRLPRKHVLDIVGEKARHLHLSLFPHQRADACSIKLVKARRNGADIGPALASAQQDARDQRVGRRLLPAHRPQEIDAEAAGLEFIRLHGGQKDIRQDLDSIVHNFFLCLVIDCIILHPRRKVKYLLLFSRNSCKIYG